MSEFIVHSVAGSPFGRSVLATLEEKGARYRFAPLAPGGSKSPEHLARHPFGRVPALEHDGFMLYETQAILRYLDRVLPTPALTPSDPQRAARMDQVMNVNDWYLFQGVGNVIGFQLSLRRGCSGFPPTTPQSRPRCRGRARSLPNWRGCWANNRFSQATRSRSPTSRSRRRSTSCR